MQSQALHQRRDLSRRVPRASAKVRGQPLADWQHFVVSNGSSALARDLAAVLGREVAEIEAIRATGAGSGANRSRKRTPYADLFERWHGRPPRDDEWPGPMFFEKRGAYEWLPLEVAFLATLVGSMGVAQIAEVLTARLKTITKDARAERTPAAVQSQIARMGLQTADVLGGITASAAGREIGSYTLVHQAIRAGLLRTRRVGRLLVISHKHWAEWKTRIQAPPEGFVQLSTLREALSISSDGKLSEFARMGYVPEAIQLRPYGTKNLHTTQFGSWYIPEAVAQRILADRRKGRPMPWHGKPLMDNLKVTFRLWEKRRHPTACPTCAQIWGDHGAPGSFEAYVERYPPLAHGAKRHLTMPWSAGLTLEEVAKHVSRKVEEVQKAISNGMLTATEFEGTLRITKTDATRWRARRCPTGEGGKSWVTLGTAMKQYLFTQEELAAFMKDGRLKSKVGTDGAMRGSTYVSRHQCSQLRETLGFTHEQAALRAKVTEPQLRKLLEGVEWRGAGGIPLPTLQAVIKRVQSCAGFNVEQAAEALGETTQWVDDRIADGTVALRRNGWDERAYITAPMLERLRAAQASGPRPQRLGAGWVRLAEAAGIAGVSTTTLGRWAEEGAVRTETRPNGRYFDADDVRTRARVYWETVRYKRAKPPGWLRAELEGAAVLRAPPPALQVAVEVARVSGKASEEAQEAHAEPSVAPRSSPTSPTLVDGLIAWLRAAKIYLSPLKVLRAQYRGLDGQRRESNSAVEQLLRRSHQPLLDLQLIAFADLDESSRREAVELAIAFTRLRREQLPAGEAQRLSSAIESVCACTEGSCL